MPTPTPAQTDLPRETAWRVCRHLAQTGLEHTRGARANVGALESWLAEHHDDAAAGRRVHQAKQLLGIARDLLRETIASLPAEAPDHGAPAPD